MNILLDGDALRQAMMCGGLRHIKAMEQCRKRNTNQPRTTWDQDIEGACAEAAVAFGLNLFWAASTEPDYHGDVGPYQVRRVDEDRKCLIIKPKDRDDQAFISVCGGRGLYVIRGWMYAATAKALRERYWRSDIDDPAYLVPARDLEPIELLLEGH